MPKMRLRVSKRKQMAFPNGNIAQLVEQRSFKPTVVGSTPTIPTSYSLGVSIQSLSFFLNMRPSQARLSFVFSKLVQKHIATSIQ